MKHGLAQADELVADIDRFVRRPDDRTGDRFDELARRGFTLQYEQVEPFRRLCDARGETPAALESGWDWRRVPAVPTMAFRSLELHVAEPREVFRSSGTTGGPGSRSVHHHPFPDLYRTVIDASFSSACLPAGETPGTRPILSLVPSREQVPDSSLSFMCEHILRRHGGAFSRVAFGADGVDLEVALGFLRDHAGQPVTILATAFALAQLLEGLQEHGAVALAVGSTLMETGGFKGRTRELSRDELLGRVEVLLGLPASHVVREYGMTELTGHVYTGVLEGRDPDVFRVPPWMRVRLLDPESLHEVPPGEPGLVAIFDLANVGSALHVVSQDLGIADLGIAGRGVAAAGGFRLLGRAEGSELRGCSLTAEELSG